MDQLPDIAGLPRPALEELFESLGVGAFHAGRVFRAIHRDRQPLEQLSQLGPRHLRTLAERTRRTGGQVAEVHPSEDGTEKLVVAFADGARVEAVILPVRRAPDAPSTQTPGRRTLCISTQAGCAMACRFCATGTLGLTRGLSAGEIVAQVALARESLEARGERLTHLVFMGMGEPLHHYKATRDALAILLDHYGHSFKSKFITVSTVGLVPRIADLARDFGGRIQLAISLHAGTDETRRRLIPVASTWDMATLRQACQAYPTPGSRWLMVEYVVLPGVNDGTADLDGLVEWTRGLPCIVNLIPFNPFAGAPYRSPTDEETTRVYRYLQEKGVAASVRRPRGRAVSGACGQLMLAPSAPNS